MLTRMKKPTLRGLGRRNNTVEAVRVDRVLKQAADGKAAKAMQSRPQASPMPPRTRLGVYQKQNGTSQKPLTPAQQRRALKKTLRWVAAWPNLGSDGSTVVDGVAPAPGLTWEHKVAQA